jgi:cytochrome P450
MRGSGVHSARRRDRRVYLGSHPVLLALLAATRRAPVFRLGRTVLVHGTAEFREALTRLPLDRRAAGTTGGVAREHLDGGVLFDEEGAGHRGSRRLVGEELGGAAIERLRPVWRELLDRRLAPLARGGAVDVVDVAAEMAGATLVAMLGLDADPRLLAGAAREAAAEVARDHLPGVRLRKGRIRSAAAAGRLTGMLGNGGERAAILAVTAVNTTVAGVPRAVAWCADARLWTEAASDERRPVLVDELLRVIAATPLLPRVAAADGSLGGHRVRAGDRLLLVTRHAVDGHRRDPDCTAPAPPHVSQLVFGAGAHACPGARLARAQLADTLAALAPYRPVVIRAAVDRRSALPGWRTLMVRAG